MSNGSALCALRVLTRDAARVCSEFKRYCCSAYTILRKHATLILNLLSLMGDANIPDLSGDLEKNLLKVQEKFRLDLSDEEVRTAPAQLPPPHGRLRRLTCLSCRRSVRCCR